MFLYFVTEPDTAEAQGEPLLASAGRTSDECWSSLATNRQRMTGTDRAENAADLQRAFTDKGYVIHKYEVTPL